MKKATLIGIVQMIMFGIAAFNYRSISEVNYFWTAVTDCLIAGISFCIVIEITEGTSRHAKFIGYVAGSTLGGVLGLFISTLVL